MACCLALEGRVRRGVARRTSRVARRVSHVACRWGVRRAATRPDPYIYVYVYIYRYMHIYIYLHIYALQAFLRVRDG